MRSYQSRGDPKFNEWCHYRNREIWTHRRDHVKVETKNAVMLLQKNAEDFH